MLQRNFIFKPKSFRTNACLFAFYFLFFLFGHSVSAQLYSRQDSLRGSLGKGRIQWNVMHYDITLKPDINNQNIEGLTTITYADSGTHLLQIDLQSPMQIDSIVLYHQQLAYTREGNVYWVKVNSSSSKVFPGIKKMHIYFHGRPKTAKHAPWDGGWVWTKDKKGNPWISAACQGLGASSWFPCKDTQSDEPDNGAVLKIIVPDSLQAIGNGRLSSVKKLDNHLDKYTWEVTSPINNYDIIPYIGKYTHFSEQFKGLKGNLDMDYWVLAYNLEKAKTHFTDANKLLTALEYWFGPYPFYTDGYKLVEAPYLGMEHQSAIAYGNGYMKGYMGSDRSGTGHGMNWDFIIVHESGHEWFGNNITANDIADMWIHESFTNYSEVLFTEYFYGKKAADEYVIGLRKNISNDIPIIGDYEVNKEGSGDMYDKGANMIHTIRQIINNDKKFRTILRGLSKEFYHQTVSTSQIEQYISNKSGIDFSPVFNQYLRTTAIPNFSYEIKSGKLFYKWTNVDANFNMPVKISIGNKKEKWLYPTINIQSIPLKFSENGIKVNSSFYVTTTNDITQ